MKSLSSVTLPLVLILCLGQLGCSKMSSSPSETPPAEGPIEPQSDPLQLSVSDSEIAPTETATLTASGGASPYVYSVVSGTGTVDASTGVFTAGATASTVEVSVEDANGDTATSQINVVIAEEPEPVEPTVRTIIYKANSKRLLHNVGAYDPAKGWTVGMSSTEAPNYLIYGPFDTDWGGGTGKATFTLMIDDVTKDTKDVAIIAVFDETLRSTVSYLKVKRSDFSTANQMRNFELDMDLAGRDGNKMQLLVYWLTNTTISAGDITLEMQLPQ